MKRCDHRRGVFFFFWSCLVVRGLVDARDKHGVLDFSASDERLRRSGDLGAFSRIAKIGTVFVSANLPGCLDTCYTDSPRFTLMQCPIIFCIIQNMCISGYALC